MRPLENFPNFLPAALRNFKTFLPTAERGVGSGGCPQLDGGAEMAIWATFFFARGAILRLFFAYGDILKGKNFIFKTVSFVTRGL